MDFTIDNNDIERRGKVIDIYERRIAILRLLNIRRFETMGNMASEFDVDIRTIRNDIVFLTTKYPIQTKRGHNGGVSVGDDFQPFKHILSSEQTKVLNDVLHKIEDTHEIEILAKIVSMYGSAS